MGLSYTTPSGDVLSTSYSDITLEVICALIGNGMAESGCNPGIWNGAADIDYSYVPSTSITTAFGCFQWYSTRRIALGNKADELSCAYYHLAFQMWYLEYENDWSGSYDSITSLSSFMNDSTHTLYDLTYAFLACWERPSTVSDSTAQARYEKSLAAYEYLSDSSNREDVSASDYVYSLDYLSTSESQTNWKYIYCWFNGTNDPSSGGGSGGGSSGGSSGSGSSTTKILNTKPYWKMMPKLWGNRSNRYRG